MQGSPKRGPAGSALVLFVLVGLLAASHANARNSIRRDFFESYSAADGTQLNVLPSNGDHCGVCHYNFNGGGQRNPYGAAVEAERDGGATNAQAFQNIEGDDSDGDGFSNLVEITDTAGYANTPTFPGLSSSNVGNTSNVAIGDVSPHLTPTTGVDTDPPSVTVTAPDGGESYAANSTVTVSWSASDPSGIASVEIYFSDDSGSTWKPVGLNLPNDGTWSWFVPNRPAATCRIQVEAIDGAGNEGSDSSNGDFTIIGTAPGYVPTTLRDIDLAGTQPLSGVILDDPTTTCINCHANYDSATEPWFNWRGSMMSNAARDPLFWACLAVAEQDAPSVGDLCIRCHSPGGWLEGHSVDTSGGQLTAKDRNAVQCDYCHRLVDWDYQPGVSPPEDQDILDDVSPLPLQYANGQFVATPGGEKRGPYSDAPELGHPTLASPFHSDSAICGTCHDVSNPVYELVGGPDYQPNSWDAEHPDMDAANMFPIERTYSEWKSSEYATTGVFAPQFAGDKPDGIVSTCQDCHMRDVTGYGANPALSGEIPLRNDLPLHDLTGGNTFIPDILPDFFPGEVDVAELQAAKTRATAMLQLAATLELTPEPFGVTVRVINETGHKLPSGYPEGRRVWLNVQAFDSQEALVFESGAYDPGTAILEHDEQAKIYEVKPGLSPALATFIGLPAGPSFHFVLNDSIYKDNRIPPRGFNNATFEAIQSPPVGYSYADGEYWDDTAYTLPPEAETVTVSLYYQTLSKEYVEFLRDENVTTNEGQELYDAWAAHGKSTPVLMAQASADVQVTTAVEPRTQISLALAAPRPNPFQGQTLLSYAVPAPGQVRVVVYDPRGRLVRTLVDKIMPAHTYHVTWNGRDDQGAALASGVYYVRLETVAGTLVRRSVLLR